MVFAMQDFDHVLLGGRAGVIEDTALIIASDFAIVVTPRHRWLPSASIGAADV